MAESIAEIEQNMCHRGEAPVTPLRFADATYRVSAANKRIEYGACGNLIKSDHVARLLTNFASGANVIPSSPPSFKHFPISNIAQPASDYC